MIGLRIDWQRTFACCTTFILSLNVCVRGDDDDEDEPM